MKLAEKSTGKTSRRSSKDPGKEDDHETADRKKKKEKKLKKHKKSKRRSREDEIEERADSDNDKNAPVVAVKTPRRIALTCVGE